MLALCLMLLSSYYAQNYIILYAGIIGSSLMRIAVLYVVIDLHAKALHSTQVWIVNLSLLYIAKSNTVANYVHLRNCITGAAQLDT